MLEVKQVCKQFGNVVALHEVSISVRKGEILSLIGESGCGKSTLLRIIAGVESLNKGAVYLDGHNITFAKPEKRKIGFVFQNISLFPHLTVEKNILFGMDKKSKSANKSEELLAIIGMTGLNRRYPHELSGGQQQRAALARALAINPKILMLDEPFSSLDELLKTKIRNEMVTILKKMHVTTLMVSHQAEDAFLIADQLAVMQKGEIRQSGTPSEIYNCPKSEYISDLLGTSVIFRGKAEKNQVRTPFGTLHVEKPPTNPSLLLRPEHIKISTEADHNIKGIVKEKLFKGPHDLLTIQSHTSNETFRLETERCAYKQGCHIFLKVPEDKILVIH